MSDNPEFDRAARMLLQGKLAVDVAVPAPNVLQLTTNDGVVLRIEAHTSSLMGTPYLKATWAQVGPAHDTQAQHMLANIGMVWLEDPNTENRPHAELLAAARSDISTLLRYALPAAHAEDVAVQAAQQAAALWREAHDAAMAIGHTEQHMADAAAAAAAEAADVRYANARAALEAHGLVRAPRQEAVAVEGAVEALVAPPGGEAFDYNALPWVEVVHSSNVDAYALPVQGATVHVRFKDGSVYEYSNVPGTVRERLHDMNNAGESVGTYLAQHLAPYSVGRVA